MSFSRWSDDSHVYTFPNTAGDYECCGCILGGRETFGTVEAFLAHLNVHRRAGHLVPEWTAGAALAWDAEHRDDHPCHADFGGPCVADCCPIRGQGPMIVRGRAWLRPCPRTHEPTAAP